MRKYIRNLITCMCVVILVSACSFHIDRSYSVDDIIEILRKTNGISESEKGLIIALGQFGHDGEKAMPVLLEKIENEYCSIHKEMAETILSISSDHEEVIDNLIIMLSDYKSTDKYKMRNAMNILGYMGKSAETAIPYLLKVIRDNDTEIYNKNDASYVLTRIAKLIDDEERQDVINELINIINDPNCDGRGIAASAIYDFGSEAKSAVPALISALDDKDDWVRRHSAGALGRIGLELNQTVQALIEGLSDEETGYDCAWALAHIGDPAGEAIPSLIEIGKDKGLSVKLRSGAIRGLGYIRTDPDIVVPVLVEMLEDELNEIRAIAALSLGDYGALAERGLTKLYELLENERDLTKVYVANAIWEINGDVGNVFTVLYESLEGINTPEARYLAMKFLPKLGPAAVDAIPRLVEIAYIESIFQQKPGSEYEDEKYIREAAAEAVKEILKD